MSGDKTQPLDLAELEALRKIAHLVGTIYFYGGFKAETYNERQLEEILKETGYRYRTEDEVLAGAALRSPRPSLEADAGIIALLRAGNLMGNLCYNGAQSEKVPEEYRKSMRECVAEWDAARERFRTPAPSLVSPPPDPAPKYRLLLANETILSGDESLDNGAVLWVPVAACWHGAPYTRIFMPIRRRVDEASEGESDGRGPA